MSTGESALVAVHLAATSAMVGIIWFVQIVHYPLFDSVGPDRFVDYEVRNTRLTSYVVGVFMALEGFSALALFAVPPADLGRAWPFAGLIARAVIHASTVLLQVPAHGKLSERFDPSVHRRLVATNWVRTLGWSARGLIALAISVAVA